jgi:hypothetical protein
MLTKVQDNVHCSLRRLERLQTMTLYSGGRTEEEDNSRTNHVLSIDPMRWASLCPLYFRDFARTKSHLHLVYILILNQNVILTVLADHKFHNVVREAAPTTHHHAESCLAFCRVLIYRWSIIHPSRSLGTKYTMLRPPLSSATDGVIHCGSTCLLYLRLSL